MDDRIIRLKQLKKDCKKAKRKYFGGWKAVGMILFALALLLTAASVIVLPGMGNVSIGNTVIVSRDTRLISAVGNLVGMDLRELILPYAQPVLMTLQIGTVAAWILFLLTLIPKSKGKKQWKKSEQYLDYRTLKNTLQQEKKMK